MSNFVLLLATLAMVRMAEADGDFEIGDVHILEKSYWYECKEGECEFKKCIVKYNQTNDGPEKCITPRNLVAFHTENGNLYELDQRNCYDIRKKFYVEEYKGNKYISDCIEREDVETTAAPPNKPICNLKGKTASHYYDRGFYKCENHEDFILQGCQFEQEECLSFSAIQREVNEEVQLQEILTSIENEIKYGSEPPRSACYLLGKNEHFETVDKEQCNFGNIKNPSDDLMKAIKAAKKAEEEATTTDAITTANREAEKDPRPIYVPTKEDEDSIKNQPRLEIPDDYDV